MKLVVCLVLFVLATAVNAFHVWHPYNKELYTCSHIRADFSSTEGATKAVMGSLVIPPDTNLNLCLAPSPGDFRQQIVLVMRGECTFVEKVKNAYVGQAKAVIIGNNVCCDNVEMRAPNNEEDQYLEVLPVAVSVDQRSYYFLKSAVLLLNTTNSTSALFPNYPDSIPSAPFVMIVPEATNDMDDRTNSDHRRYYPALYWTNVFIIVALCMCLALLRSRRRFDNVQLMMAVPPGGAPGGAAQAVPSNAVPRTVYAPSAAYPGVSAVGQLAAMSAAPAVVPYRVVPVQAAPSAYVPAPEASMSPTGVAADGSVMVSRNGYARVPQEMEMGIH